MWGIDPNTEHQLWTEWRFHIFETGRHVPFKEVEYNVAKWLRSGFGSVGQVRVTEKVNGYLVEAHIEGADARDEGFVEAVKSQFQKNFVEKGWGDLGAFSSVEVRIIAGDKGDGKPRSQLIVLPTINLEEVEV